MTGLRVFWRRLRGLFSGSRADRELNDEIRSHIEMQIEDGLARGLTAEQARREALLRFGGVERIKEEYRDRRSLPLVETALQDLRHAVRLFRRNPAVSLVAVLTLALGIGANTAIFSVINAVVLAELPLVEPERLTVIWGKLSRVDQVEQSPEDFDVLIERSRSFEQIAATERANFNLTGAGDPVRLEAQCATANLFATLGAAPLLGRTFTEEEDRQDAHVALLDHRLWQGRFGGDAGVIGRSISLDGAPYTVIGVMPAGFEFPAPISNRADIWTPRSLATERARKAHNLLVIGRLKSGVTQQQARAELEGIAHQRAREDGQPPGDEYGVNPIPMTAQIGRQQRPALYILAGAVGFVLLIACANVASLLLALAAGRRREIALRLALGAQRGRIIRQLATESLLLASVGGGVGLLLAYWLGGTIRVYAVGQLPRAESIGIDASVLIFTMLVSMLTGLIFGLAPALSAARADLNSAIKGGGRGATGAKGQRLRGVLAVIEIAAALVLLAGAGLLIKSFRQLQQVDPGFDPNNLLGVEITLPESKYPDSRSRAAFHEQALEKISALPGIKGAAIINHPPLSGRRGISIFPIEGRPETRGVSDAPLADFRFVSPDYFGMMGIPLLQGRALLESDALNAPPVVVINRAYADLYAQGEDLTGRRVRVGEEWHTVVGVVGDVRQSGPDREAAPHVYVSYRQANTARAGLLVRTSGDPLQLAAAVRAQVLAVDREQPVYNIRAMADLLAEAMAGRRLNLALLTGFALLAVVLASAGIYGVMANMVAQRTGEIGLRLALGAKPVDVMSLVIGRGMGLALAGVAVGAAGALMLTRLMESLLFGVSAHDPATLGVAGLILMAVALAACWIPARRAMRVDPMIALRYEGR
ncbi:MAG: ABC transporter permease [Blastocatellales bacterium]|nr:ABC transporter permease [Blastocatellales bacterium]